MRVGGPSPLRTPGTPQGEGHVRTRGKEAAGQGERPPGINAQE